MRDLETKKVYIAGPMRHQPSFGWYAFKAAEVFLQDFGCTVFNPARHDADMGFKLYEMTGQEDLVELGFDIKVAFKWDLERICESDAILLLPGWQQSQGAMTEFRVARMMGIPTYLYNPNMGFSGSATLFEAKL